MVLSRAHFLAALFAAASPGLAESPFGGAIGGPFELVDQRGHARSEADPAGRPQLLFFGYASCDGICSHVLPAMGELTEALAADGLAVTPVLITIAPEHDTPETLARALPAFHRDFVGLTGDAAALAAARAAYQVEIETLFEDPAGRPVFAHGSFVYLLDASGTVLTLMPPVLGIDRMAEIVEGYLQAPAAGG
ncbi:MAG TPA: SCO family protein [Amaricoccus sp.]|uniref:SCO family protein n=1 Tax=Amaricoccus sp. TaxID=1872485 RepID=UPI002D188627|nr:SCO family protein [Amaricoccus sp.]HMQ94478.1 SCO family protein [Amaricoccus sp.]HMR54683.1 SCO family protein [Amaricoccus sp.]HMR61570.1 SCO family protein [Amaricoccus sp.]HMU01718.1 SCO family protein [Amaricoccus sp.]